MEYNEIITTYKNKTLAIDTLKQDLLKAKDLKGRPKYRVLDVVSRYSVFHIDSVNILRIPERGEKVELFEESLNYVLDVYFQDIIENIKANKAWRQMNLNPREHSYEEFKTKSISNKIKEITMLNKEYFKYVEIQRTADLRDKISMLGIVETDDQIRRMEFVRKMFGALKNMDMQKELYCFQPAFIKSLIAFKNSKILRIEEFMALRRKGIQREYEKFSKFYATENFRDLANNIVFTSKTAKMTTDQVIACFSDISESNRELESLLDERDLIRSLAKKYIVMSKIKVEYIKEQKEKEEADRERQEIEEQIRKEEEAKKRLQEEERKRKEAIQKAEADRQIGETEGSTGSLKESIDRQANTPSAKEQVNPIFISWLGKDDTSLTKKVGSKRLKDFFDRLKKLEEQTGVRASVFLITNADKETTLNRVRDFKAKAATNGFPRLVEGAYGAYSSFMVDSEENVKDISIMSDVNRKKIIRLLENNGGRILNEELIDNTEQNYLRYRFTTNGKDKSVSREYLQAMIGRVLSDPLVSRQPLKFLSYFERNGIGIDVLLASQVAGLSQLAEYYKTKYVFAPGKTISFNLDDIDRFIDDQTTQVRTVQEEK